MVTSPYRLGSAGSLAVAGSLAADTAVPAGIVVDHNLAVGTVYLVHIAPNPVAHIV